MKVKIILSLCAAFLVSFTVLSVLPINGEEQIYNDMIRLHVIANSDSATDQNLKLKVRDAVLDVMEKEDFTKDKDTAEAFLGAQSEMLMIAAENVVREEGYSYPVKIRLGIEDYPERHYDGFVLPAGKYTSLRIIIGSGKGHNWWCVLYPPLCRTASESREDVFIAAGFSDEQYKIITETGNTKYKVKFKILEILEELFESKSE